MGPIAEERSLTPAGLAWAVLATATAPLWRLHLRRRLRQGKELPGRLPERWGEDAARPPGTLLWLHAASVGESLSLLPLLEQLLPARPDLHFLVTTGTVTSARLLLERLPPALRPRVIHRFVPLDVPRWAARFLRNWRPDAGVFVESELWPNLLRATRRAGLPMVLVNARLSEGSARGWRWAPGLAREALGAFRAVLTQGEEDARRFRALGAGTVVVAGNLKYAAEALPADPEALRRLRDALGDRPVLLAASTHPGEEAIVAAAHARLRERLPRLLTVIAPRHPERGEELARALPGTPRRSAGVLPAPGDGLFLADTLGELGLFYRVAGAALVGRSLLPPGGGQNPLEPARLGCPVILGPHMGNFRDITAALLEAGGAVQLVVPHFPTQAPEAPVAEALAEVAGDVLTDTDCASRLRDAAAGVASGAAGVAERIAEAILPLLPAAS
ncbi:3-deoxy-D-manno-octulosonic acid transferase [Roseomonas elaeocarpi]|uniref:3-deoxy-D-manno-octulosonic acid transferase n=1 Tax=Roseomonas elaeocarpi TaxID=907779 RepID=A0ABV6JZ75_9PROT